MHLKLQISLWPTERSCAFRDCHLHRTIPGDRGTGNTGIVTDNSGNGLRSNLGKRMGQGGF